MRACLSALVLLTVARALAAQSVLERSPNLQGTWTLPSGHAAFVFAHRFELLNGGDELRNLPTLTVALGLPLGLTAGLDYTSNSEIIRAKQGGNETEYWLKRAVPLGGRTTLSGMAAYNSAAGSVDGAVDARWTAGRLALLGELRGFSDMFGSGEPGAAAALGAVLHLTPYLGLAGDVGRVLSSDSFPSVWSAALAVAIPGTPHTFSLQASNVGATTLHGASRTPIHALKPVRWGFTFTVPLGTGSQWSRIFRPAAPPAADAAGAVADSGVVRVDMRQIAYQPREVRIRAGQSVEWVNLDPVAHTVTADDRSWGSELLNEGQRFVHRFDRPGRYPYHCVPHPMMTGVVVVDP